MDKLNQSVAPIHRQKAEELLKNKPSKKEAKLLDAEILRLIHEFEAHKVELELKNKELAFQNEEKQKRADELKIATKELELFSYSVSHDLRAHLRHFSNLLKP